MKLTDCDASMNDEAINRPTTRAKRRHRRCYELSWLAFDEMDEPGDWRLVHGIVDGPKGVARRMGHAWLTDGVEVFDPVLNLYYTVRCYRNRHNAKVVATYDMKQMREMTSRHKHFGPWDEPVDREEYLRAHDWPEPAGPHNSSDSRELALPKLALIRRNYRR